MMDAANFIIIDDDNDSKSILVVSVFVVASSGFG